MIVRWVLGIIGWVLTLSLAVAQSQDALPREGTRIVFTGDVPFDSSLYGVALLRMEELIYEFHPHKEEPSPQINREQSLFSSRGSFFVYRKNMIQKKPHGEIHYKVTLQVHKTRVSYRFEQFIFHEYGNFNKRERGLSRPTGMTKPLEDESYLGFKDDWRDYKLRTKEKVDYLTGVIANRIKP